LSEPNAEKNRLVLLLESEIAKLIDSRTKTAGSIHEDLRASLIQEIGQQKFLEAKEKAAARVLSEQEEATRQLSVQSLQLSQLQGE